MESSRKRKSEDELTLGHDVQVKKPKLASQEVITTSETSADGSETNSSSNHSDSNNHKTNSCNMSWGYDKDNGPDTWCKSFPAANGPRQSPVDIKPQTVSHDTSLSGNPLTINYQQEPNLNLENPGLSFKANISANSVISGGPLGNTKYKLEQFHFHWGHDDQSGSEHTVDGKMWPSELHLVHFNADKYKTFADAVNESDGLAVIGVFINVGQTDHPGFKILSDNMQKVNCKGKKVDTGVPFNPASLLPEDTSEYWTYEGSLTTPPCYESVRWIVLRNEISVSPEQLRAMRNLCCDDCGAKPIPPNYRPPLPLGNRVVRASFK